MLYISFLAHNLSDSYRNLIQISSGIFIFAVELPQNILQPFGAYSSKNLNIKDKTSFLSCSAMSMKRKIYFLVSFMTLQFQA